MPQTVTSQAWARYALLGCVLFLLTIGVVMIYSCDVAKSGTLETFEFEQIISRQAFKQCIWIAFGGSIGWFLSRLDYEKQIVTWIPWAYLVFCALLLYLAFAAILHLSWLPLIGDTKGGYRWLAVSWIKVQPSEFAKLATTLVACLYFNRNANLLAPEQPFVLTRTAWRQLWGQERWDGLDSWARRWWKEHEAAVIWPALLMGIPTFLILMGKSLSMTVLAFMQFALLSFCAGVRRTYLLGAAAILAYFTWCAWDYGVHQEFQLDNKGTKYRMFDASGKKVEASPFNLLHYIPENWAAERLDRLTSWQHPEELKLRGGSQLWLSRLALGSGGWTGLGLGESRLKRDYLPEAHNDFIISVLGEEFGYAGCLLVLFLYGGVMAAATAISIQAKNNRLLMFSAMGLGLSIACHAFINVGVASGFLPTTGITAPFLSYGGSSMVVSLITVGLLWSVSKTAERQLREEQLAEPEGRVR